MPRPPKRLKGGDRIQMENANIAWSEAEWKGNPELDLVCDAVAFEDLKVQDVTSLGEEGARG